MSENFTRPSQRSPNEIRKVTFERNYTKHAEGSVKVCFGDTQVICTASVEDRVPGFLRGEGQGWLTAEYGMLPRSTGSRMQREAAKGKQSGRTQEISRLIGRSLRACIDLKDLGERTILIDCDVIQADGGTRTASITGAYIALNDAIEYLIRVGELKSSPLTAQIASVSVGVYKGQVVADLDYIEDSSAETDLNIVMNHQGDYIEVQGTAEDRSFSHKDLLTMLDYGKESIKELIELQKQAINS